MKEVRTLCERCISDYRDAGYKVVVVGTVREKCDFCGRGGRLCNVKRYCEHPPHEPRARRPRKAFSQ